VKFPVLKFSGSKKKEVIEGNTKGIEFLFKKNKIDWIKGWATIPSVGSVKVNDKTYQTKNIIIASGSSLFCFS